MHHQEHSGDSPGTGSRKAAYHYRRGSSSSASASAASLDDNSTQAGSSSPGLHQQAQSQGPGAQVKKKSGFQITSVTSAQINISGNNSLADDTESYDDMDESHTEDLSSSEMLDVSVPRATDTGLPERSSSDETLNSLHGMDTPGLVSPNEPLHPHSLHQAPQKHSSMVNGAVHHPYYPHQHSLPHLHHSESIGGGEASTPVLPSMPLASSSPLSKAGNSQTQMDSLKLAAGPSQPLIPVLGAKAPPYRSDAHQQGSVNLSTVAAAAAAAAPPPPGPSGFDSPGVTGPAASTGGGTAAPVTQSQQTQTATGSRFRVVKLDTNSEPFRKGRWTCTEYYEKEIPSATVSEAPKGAEAAAETEAANSGMSPGPPAVQPPHTLQPYQLPSQDFSSPQAMQSPPQALVQPTPLTFVSPQEAVGVSGMQKPAAPVSLPAAPPQVMAPAGGSQPQQLPYGLDHHHAPAQGGYPTTQLGGGVSVRQPDFIQPTAPFQTQVQPPLQHGTTSITPGSGVTAQPPVGITQQLPHQGQGAPHPQTQAHPASPPYMPLSALQADLQPLLTPGTTLTQPPLGGSSPKTSQLEDAQKLLFQHQGLLGLPRLGMGAGGEGGTEAGGATGHLAHMGMSAEASAFMAAAAAGLRSQPAEGEDDSSSGASVVAIDNKIEQAMDLVKSHLMYAVREEVEVLKEQIKELIERNTQLEQENNLLKTLASPEQMAQFQAQVQTGGSPTGAVQPPAPGSAGTQALPSSQNSGPSA